MAPTETTPLVDVAIRLSQLASDLGDVIAACDLNPVLVRKGSGEIRVVDALFVRQPSAASR